MKKRWNGIYAPDWYEGEPEPSIALTDSEQQIQSEGLEFFGRAAGVLARIWEFMDDQAPQIPLPRNRNHVIPGTDIHLIWPFVRGRVVLHSANMLRQGVSKLQISFGVLFDSNMYNEIYDFVERPNTMPGPKREGVALLIETLCANNYDYHALPYILEQYCNNSQAIADEYAYRMVRALLKLHTMDQEYFRATHLIRPSSERLQLYFNEYGQGNYDVLAARQLASMKPDISVPPDMVKFNQICLMKMALIKQVHLRGKGIQKQAEAFDDFILNEVGFIAGTMQTVAIFYFAGELNGFVRAQVGGNAQRQTKLLNNCAWDIYLASLPEQLLAVSEEPIATTYFFCTREPDLAKLVALSETKACIIYADKGSVWLRHIDEALLFQALGSEAERLLNDLSQRVTDHQQRRISGKTVPKRFDMLGDLYSSVEQEFLSRMCI